MAVNGCQIDGGAFIARGHRWKADLWASGLDDRSRCVIKDFRAKPWLGRLWGRIQIAREVRCLGRIQQLPQIPRLVAVHRPCAIVLELRPGVPIGACRPDGRPALARLREAIDAAHRAGVVHNDLRARGNILVDPQTGEVALVDWAAGIYLRPGSIAHRLLFRALRLVDEAGYLKWKLALAPNDLSPAEVRFLAWFERVRWLWPFNRKKRQRRGGTRRKAQERSGPVVTRAISPREAGPANEAVPRELAVRSAASAPAAPSSRRARRGAPQEAARGAHPSG